MNGVQVASAWLGPLRDPPEYLVLIIGVFRQKKGGRLGHSISHFDLLDSRNKGKKLPTEGFITLCRVARVFNRAHAFFIFFYTSIDPEVFGFD